MVLRFLGTPELVIDEGQTPQGDRLLPRIDRREEERSLGIGWPGRGEADRGCLILKFFGLLHRCLRRDAGTVFTTARARPIEAQDVRALDVGGIEGRDLDAIPAADWSEEGNRLDIQIAAGRIVAAQDRALRVEDLDDDVEPPLVDADAQKPAGRNLDFKPVKLSGAEPALDRRSRLEEQRSGFRG